MQSCTVIVISIIESPLYANRLRATAALSTEGDHATTWVTEEQLALSVSVDAVLAPTMSLLVTVGG